MPEGLKKSRLKTFVDLTGYHPDMPDVDECAYLVEYLFRVGPVMQGGFGAVNLPFQEIESWAKCNRINLTGWEFETLSAMSKAYAYQSSVSSKRDCMAPWVSRVIERTEAEKEKIDDELLKRFSSLAKTNSTKTRRKSSGEKAPPRRGKTI